MRENADTRLHPASLTKMMTLYITFQAIEHGEISLDTMVTVSANAANEPPSKLGLRAGQKIQLRYLIRAAAIKSANDCRHRHRRGGRRLRGRVRARMNRTAKALGMTRTTFKNANGLTEAGHLSTARDMTILGRHLFYDHPEYYNLFSRRSLGCRRARPCVSTNRRFLDSYDGADGIKTGYTVAAGFNLVASAERGSERIIATIFGGTSTAARNAKMAELLDLGFRKAPSHVREKKPAPPLYADVEGAPAAGDDDRKVVRGSSDGDAAAAAKTIRISGAPTHSQRPRSRPGAPVEAPPPELLAAMQGDIRDTLAAVAEEVAEETRATEPTAAAPVAVAPAPPRPDRADRSEAVEAAATADPPDTALAAADGAPAKAPPEPAEAVAGTPADSIAVAEAATPLPTAPAPAAMAELGADLTPPGVQALALVVPAGDPETEVSEDAFLDAEDDEIDGETLLAAAPALFGAAQAGETVLASAPAGMIIEPETFAGQGGDPVVITRLSTSGGRHWGINVGTYNSRYEAEKVLLRTALMEIGTLDDALRKVGKSKRGYEANFLGMTQDLADLACRRLTARGIGCTQLGPNS